MKRFRTYLREQSHPDDIPTAVTIAVDGIKKIDRSLYDQAGGDKGERLYNAEVKMHVDKAKNQFHSKHHDEIHQLIMDALPTGKAK